jgi:hypothetical protein
MMTNPLKQIALKELRQIPGVGKSIAEDLWSLGIRSIGDLRKKYPEELYLQLCSSQGGHVDRCMLYVFRCAVYYATRQTHDPELLKWWNWKDEKVCTSI